VRRFSPAVQPSIHPRSGFITADPCEREADHFAATLLMHWITNEWWQFPTLFPAESRRRLDFGFHLYSGFHVYYLVSNFIPWIHLLLGFQLYSVDTPRCGRPGVYSTVTLFARFRGLSTSQPRSTAMW
jgi:hypothetical protein